jgi:hypothetical protein
MNYSLKICLLFVGVTLALPSSGLGESGNFLDKGFLTSILPDKSTGSIVNVSQRIQEVQDS